MPRVTALCNAQWLVVHLQALRKFDDFDDDDDDDDFDDAAGAGGNVRPVTSASRFSVAGRASTGTFGDKTFGASTLGAAGGDEGDDEFDF